MRRLIQITDSHRMMVRTGTNTLRANERLLWNIPDGDHVGTAGDGRHAVIRQPNGRIRSFSVVAGGQIITDSRIPTEPLPINEQQPERAIQDLVGRELRNLVELGTLRADAEVLQNAEAQPRRRGGLRTIEALGAGATNASSGPQPTLTPGISSTPTRLTMADAQQPQRPGLTTQGLLERLQQFYTTNPIGTPTIDVGEVTEPNRDKACPLRKAVIYLEEVYGLTIDKHRLYKDREPQIVYRDPEPVNESEEVILNYCDLADGMARNILELKYGAYDEDTMLDEYLKLVNESQAFILKHKRIVNA